MWQLKLEDQSSGLAIADPNKDSAGDDRKSQTYVDGLGLGWG